MYSIENRACNHCKKMFVAWDMNDYYCSPRCKQRLDPKDYTVLGLARQSKRLTSVMQKGIEVGAKERHARIIAKYGVKLK